jgi:hypothetical protein
MLNPTDVQAALRDRVVFACAMCERYWWGKDRGLPYCEATAMGDECGGPLAGLTYPRYLGPLTDFVPQCFVCGDPSDAMIEKNAIAHPGARALGICKAHYHVLTDYSAPGKPPVFVTKQRIPVLER